MQNIQGPRVLAPHNWAIMYRLNDRMKRLLNRWRMLQITLNKTGSDQVRILARCDENPRSYPFSNRVTLLYSFRLWETR